MLNYGRTLSDIEYLHILTEYQRFSEKFDMKLINIEVLKVLTVFATWFYTVPHVYSFNSKTIIGTFLC